MATLQIILFILGSYFVFYSLYWFILTLLSTERKTGHPRSINEQNPEILIVLPAYKPSRIFFDVLDAAEKVSKNRDIHVYVLLQEADHQYTKYAQEKGFYTEEKMFSHLGGNSYHHALRHISKVVLREQQTGRWSPEFVMLLDKDNLISKDFFNNIPENIYDRFDIIQGKRTPIGTHTSTAFFDGLTETLNDNMFRIAKQKIGGMVEISGSGVLVETDLFVDTIHNLDRDAPGFDKNFMIQMLTSKRDVRSIFWKASELKEEKTSDMHAHNPQRLRWFGEQYYNALFNAGSLLKAFRAYRRFAALDYLITLWRPPRSVQFVMAPALAFVETAWHLYYGNWLALYPLFTLSTLVLILAVTIFLVSQGLFFQALRHGRHLPNLAFNNVFNALRSVKKENRGTFIHTTHKL